MPVRREAEGVENGGSGVSWRRAVLKWPPQNGSEGGGARGLVIGRGDAEYR